MIAHPPLSGGCNFPGSGTQRYTAYVGVNTHTVNVHLPLTPLFIYIYIYFFFLEILYHQALLKSVLLYPYLPYRTNVSRFYLMLRHYNRLGTDVNINRDYVSFRNFINSSNCLIISFFELQVDEYISYFIKKIKNKYVIKIIKMKIKKFHIS